MEFAYDGGGLGKGGTATLPSTAPRSHKAGSTPPSRCFSSSDETTDVGDDSGTPVSDDLGPQAGHLKRRIEWVQIDLGDDAADADHYTSPDERLRVAMSIQ
jgi:arylsulfatase